MKLVVIAGVLTACAIALSAGPALGQTQGEGTVSAQVTVTVIAPCIQVTPSQLDFGTEGLSPSAQNPETGVRNVTATNCGGAASLYARGTNAASTTSGTSWTLEPNPAQVCPTPNRFSLLVANSTGSTALSSESRLIQDLASGQAQPLSAQLVMPCVGSAGAGEVMGFSYIFVAAVA